jgi:Rrf2 family protein
MRVSAKAEYACVAVLELAAHHGAPQPLTVKAIAETHAIPERYLVQILLQLKGAGFVTSTRGAAGGYQLTMTPDQLSLLDVMEAIDEPLPTGHKPKTSPTSRATKAICLAWDEVLATERQMLSDVTFADLAQRMKEPMEGMYYI